MKTSSDTSTPGTESAGETTRPSSRSADPTIHFGLPSEGTGSSCTGDSTETEVDEDTYTSEECEFEFLYQDGDRHPVGLVCVTHDMTFDVGTGI